ncbi:hypothetical protein WR25_02101 isoform C [Diploscapter pachys]|nr:hypothetical protein WR25_02101 isoform B [Diploscapter pachys]PAV69604.1 hypothetical protein WR25_02101 isoform C [Diploscapter pachys]
MKDKFLYFDVRGRGEAIRQLMVLGGHSFEDVRISMEEWPGFKDQMPLGQVPVLEVNGTKIGQSVAILRYLGHQLRRAGSTPLECARLDMIGEVVQEFTNTEGAGKLPAVLLGFIKANKEEFYKTKIVPDVDKYAPIIERFLLENGNNGLFSGDRETWVDIFAAETFSKLTDYASHDALDAYPRIQALITRIHNIPAIKEHIAKRKPTPA